jgi:hypothetical protein
VPIADVVGLADGLTGELVELPVGLGQDGSLGGELELVAITVPVPVPLSVGVPVAVPVVVSFVDPLGGELGELGQDGLADDVGPCAVDVLGAGGGFFLAGVPALSGGPGLAGGTRWRGFGGDGSAGRTGTVRPGTPRA